MNKKENIILKNLLFVISAMAYVILAVPAEPKWLLLGVAIIVLFYVITRFVPNIHLFLKNYYNKRRLIISFTLSMLLGFRFEKVWRYSGQISDIALRIGISSAVILYSIGIILGLMGIYFCFAMLSLFLEVPLKWFRSAGIQKKDDNRRIWDKGLLIGIAVVLILQGGILTYWGIQKEGYHVDEVYTFELSNYQYTNYGDMGGAYGSWISGSDLKTVAEPDGTELFNFTIPYWNSETDNHPLTYYSVIHLFSSVSKMFHFGISKWIGLIPNFIACLCATVVLILMCYELIKKRWIAVIMGAFWAMSIGAINTGVYIRMYAFLTFWCVLFAFLHLLFYKNLQEQKLNLRFVTIMEVCTTAGILSQYYFLIFAFFTCAITFFMIVFKRKWQILKGYVGMEFCGIFMAELLFPRMVVRLFFGDRGAEALSNVATANIVVKLKEILQVINDELFAGYGPIIIGIGAVIFTIGIVEGIFRKEFITIDDKFVMQMAVVSILFVVAITKLAPYMSDRYFMCSFPIILMCCAYFFYRGFILILHDNKLGRSISAVILTVLVGTILAVGYQTQKVKYIYSDQIERRSDIEEYGDIPVVTVNADSYDDSTLKWLFELQNYSDLFLCHHEDFSDIKIAASAGKLDGGFLLYAHMYKDESAVIDEVKKYIEISNYELITDVGDCAVFYIQ